MKYTIIRKSDGMILGDSEVPENAADRLTVLSEQVPAWVPRVGVKSQLRTMWDVLPMEVRAAFRPLKPAIIDALDDGCPNEARLIISRQQVLPEFEAVKQQMLEALK